MVGRLLRVLITHKVADMEDVDILTPPTFQKSGVVKPRNQAIPDEDWIGTFNLWIIRSEPEPAIIYQQRSPQSTWAPNKLDVTAGGHYQAGETLLDGLREVQEELGKSYQENQLTYLGRKLHVSPDERGQVRHNVVEIFFVVDNSPLESYTLEKNEVFTITALPVQKLINVHTQNISFEVAALTFDQREISIVVTQDSFPYNWDNYHFKIALLAERFLKGEKNLVY